MEKCISNTLKGFAIATSLTTLVGCTNPEKIELISISSQSPVEIRLEQVKQIGPDQYELSVYDKGERIAYMRTFKPPVRIVGEATNNNGTVKISNETYDIKGYNPVK